MAWNKGGRGPSWFNMPKVTVAEAGREFAFNRSGPGIGSYTWRYRLEPTDTGTRVTEKWTGSSDRDADLRRGMETTLDRIKATAEAR